MQKELTLFRNFDFESGPIGKLILNEKWSERVFEIAARSRAPLQLSFTFLQESEHLKALSASILFTPSIPPELPDVMFSCKKCGHNLYVTKTELQTKIIIIMDKECPNCGEEGYCNWVLDREGDYGTVDPSARIEE